jgi:UDP-glucose 4-epimerase
LKVLITGGAGYIGSTVASACIDSGITPVIVDNLSRGRVEFVRNRIFYRGDVADQHLVDKIFLEHPDISATIHCAGLIVVSESIANPLRYYYENVFKTGALVQSILRNGCTRMIFSSSASIYQGDDGGAIDESGAVDAKSPYARTKAMTEDLLRDISHAEDIRVISLRYFNPIGADPAMRSGLQSVHATHVLGQMISAYQSAKPFKITGVTFPTRDGSGLRDYIHVWDLALGHVAALARFDDILNNKAKQSYEALNLGAGHGVTVRELLSAFEAVVGTKLLVEEADSRPGDVAGCYTTNTKSAEYLGWHPRLTLGDGIRTALQWQRVFAGQVESGSDKNDLLIRQRTAELTLPAGDMATAQPSHGHQTRFVK